MYLIDKSSHSISVEVKNMNKDSVGGEITKRLVQNGLNNISGSYTQR